MENNENKLGDAYYVKRSSQSIIEPEEILLDAALHETGDPAIRSSRLELPVAARAAKRFLACIALSLFALAAYAAYLQIIKGDYYSAVAEKNCLRSFSLPAPRGIIYDRSRSPIVENISSFNIVITPIDLPYKSDDRSRLLGELAEILGMPLSLIASRIEEEGVFSPNPILIARHIDREKALLLETKQELLQGIRIEQSTFRSYPLGEIFSHVLGYTGLVTEEVLESDESYTVTDEIGIGGMEKSYETILKGANGERRITRDAEGNNIAETLFREPVPGKGIILSIDKGLQEKLYSTLLRETTKRNSPGAAAVAIDPASGKVRAIVSLPSYDNNLFVLHFSDSELEEILQCPDKPLFNRAVSGSYPPGSSIKPYIGVAALEEGIVEPYERVMAHAAITIQNIYNPGITYVFHDWKEHGLITMPEAIAQSSNVFFYTIGGGHDGIEGLGAPRIKSYLSRFGFGSLLGVDLPGEEKDTIPSPEWKEAEKGEMWYIGDTYNMAIGQGNLSVTPLHLAAGLSAIANGGTLYKPQLVESILSQDRKSEEEVKPVAIQTAISSSENIQVVREGMRRAVTSGTARGLGSVPVAVAAKTGTAQSGGEKNPHSWISSFAPYENPEIALVVLIEEGGEGSGGALSVAQDVLSWYFGQAR